MRAFTKTPTGDLVACIVLSLLVGAIAGAIALRNDELQAPVLVVIAACGTLGCVFPRRMILVSAIVGAAVPLAYLIARLTHWREPMATVPGSELIAFVAAFGATFLGSRVRRRLIARAHTDVSSRAR